MYKTLNRLNVHITGVEHPSYFYDDINSSNGTAALMQVKAGRDIDVIASFGGVQNNAIIPYHAIEYVVVSPDRQEGPDPVDDNCNTGGGGEPGTLKIVNASGVTLHVSVAIDAEIEGTYGDLTFAIDAESTPDYPLSRATIDALADGATVTATGLPDGVTLEVTSEAGATQGTVPCTIMLVGEQPGPK